MTEKETATLLTMIQRAYRKFFKAEFDPKEFKAEVLMWHEVFKDVSFDDASTAFFAWLAEEEFPPSPANLNKKIKKAQKPDVFLAPELAWAKAHKTVTRTFGRYNKVAGMAHLNEYNPAIAKAVEAVGYEAICNAEDSDIGYKKRDFMTYYEEYSSSEKQANLLPEQIYKQIQEMSQKDIKRLGDKQNDVSEM